MKLDSIIEYDYMWWFESTVNLWYFAKSILFVHYFVPFAKPEQKCSGFCFIKERSICMSRAYTEEEIRQDFLDHIGVWLIIGKMKAELKQVKKN